MPRSQHLKTAHLVRHSSAKTSAKATQPRAKTSRPRISRPSRVSRSYSNKLSVADLINAESALGRTLFGPIPRGHQREFFTSERNVWIWHENWFDQLGQPQEITIRYEVRPDGVFKRVDKGSYQKIAGDELTNFRHAAHSYLNLVKKRLYC